MDNAAAENIQAGGGGNTFINHVFNLTGTKFNYGN